MPSLAAPGDTSAVLAQCHRYVEHKQHWEDDWLLLPYLIPVSCVSAAGPAIDEADFLWRFGSIKPEDYNAFFTAPRFDIDGWYIRILIQYTGEDPQVVWTGVVVDQQYKMLNNNGLTGDQQIKAYGLAYFLERTYLRTSWAEAIEGEEPVEVSRVIPFNRPERLRGWNLLGNRSTNKYEMDDINSYYFSMEDAYPWTNKNIIEYLMDRFFPSAIEWELTGQVDALDKIVLVHNLDGLSLWECLSRLIDRRRGLGFVVEPNAETGTVAIRVFTLVGADVTYGGKTLPANTAQSDFTFPTSLPYTHMVEQPTYRITSLNRYDEVEIRGDRILVCGTWYYDNGSLEAGWTGTKEEDYTEAQGSDDPKINDEDRATDYFEGVFERHVVPIDWNWRVKGGSVLVTLGDDGSVSDYEGADPPPNQWNHDHVFERMTPLEAQKEYTTNPAINFGPDTGQPEYLPTFALIKSTQTAAFNTTHKPTERYYYVDRINQSIPSIPNSHLSVLDRGLGFNIRSPWRHLMAGAAFANFDPAATNHYPELIYTYLYITSAIRIDQRPRIKLTNISGTPHEVPRKLFIDVPSAQHWRVVEGTVVGLLSDGLPAIVNPDPSVRVLRDDKDKLEAIAAFCKAWYGVKRQAITLPIRRLGVWVPIGTYITQINALLGTTSIQTVISSRRMDFYSDTTLIETGYGEYDLAQAFVGTIE